MTIDIYSTEVSSNFVAFDFINKGEKGENLKGVRFTKTEIENVWNLGFGDIDALTGEINDVIV